ncbi:hypothetical protein TCDM_09483 [Trypanosoma cruzi Dm28c]|uniref:Uncharacterized protein n=1 Tax=Trypanosoma cruzi Dm28c TaxID=1416333 RepID=V5APY6_TRYCR|nr:hypothetical protein TCDM_09483 [Trypanosoma cruzi Dm28c]
MPSWRDPSPAGLRQCLAHGIPHRSQTAVLKEIPGGKGRHTHRVTGAFRCGGTPFLMLTRTSCPSGGSPHRRDATPACSSTGPRALRITRNPLCRWCRPFLYRGDRPAAASAGTSSRRKLRNFLSTSERRIDILLLNLRQGAPVCPQYYGTCRTCSAWRSGSLTGLTCGCRDYFMVFLAGTSRPGRHRRSKHASRQGTQEAQTRVLEMDQALPPPLHHRRHVLLIPTDHGRLRLIHFGNALSLRIWTVTAWDCSSPHDGPHATECLPRYC